MRLWQSVWSAAAESPSLLHHATGGGCCVGAVEHWSWHLWLLPHQCHGGEDPHTGKCPLYSPVCDRSPVSRSYPAHDLHTMEKTLNFADRCTHLMFIYCTICCITQGSFDQDVGQSESLAHTASHAWDHACSERLGCPRWGQKHWWATKPSNATP